MGLTLASHLPKDAIEVHTIVEKEKYRLGGPHPSSQHLHFQCPWKAEGILGIIV